MVIMLCLPITPDMKKEEILEARSLLKMRIEYSDKFKHTVVSVSSNGEICDTATCSIPQYITRNNAKKLWKCDYICFARNWQFNSHCRNMFKLAHTYGIPMLFEESLPRYPEYQERKQTRCTRKNLSQAL